uniref:Variant surface glycoprotein 1125.4850 n=1 Tax=Trypanosoma brucei TaxID=5691 RepID=A0A1J0RAZ2_9TRYP|nr:variant surface glycoprotein 1125.4850 [Trypanosoma brucei]
MLAHAPAKCHNVVYKPDSRSREIVFFVFFLSLATCRPANTAAGDNAKEHNLMCRLTQMAGRQLAIPELDTSANTIASNLNELNASTSGLDWLSLFKVEDETKRSPEFPKNGPAAQNKADWEARWPAWYAPAAAAHDRLKKAPKPNPYPLIKDDGQKQALHSITEQLAAVADELNTKALLLQKQIQTTNAAEAAAAIKAAVFGQATSADDPAAAKFLGAATNRATACAGAAIGKSILGDFYCLCTGSTNGATECGSGYAGTNGGGKITFGKTELTDLMNTCIKPDEREITASEIAATIAEFSSALSRTNDANGKKVTLGKTTAHTCGGGLNEICVSYGEHFAKQSKKGIEEIPWVRHLRAAEKKLQAMERAATQHAALTAQLLALKRQMDVAYAAALQIRLQTNQKAAESPKAAQHESHTTHKKQQDAKLLDAAMMKTKRNAKTNQ